MSVHSTGRPSIQYVGYDKTTGLIVHTHAKYSAEAESYVEMPIEEIKARFSGEATIVGQLSGQDPQNLDYIKLGQAELRKIDGPMMVDPAKKKLVSRPKLAVSVSKTEILGDGSDHTEIDITVVDARGKVLTSASGSIKVTTTRGRLSHRGGVVDLVKGRAAITLTSVNETVHHVRVAAAHLDDPFVPGHIDVEFV